MTQNELVVPTSVKSCRDKTTGLMVSIDTLPVGALFAKVAEEDMEAMLAYAELASSCCRPLRPDGGDIVQAREKWAMEVMDSIIARYTLLEQHGVDIADIMRKVYEKNKERGYYDEV